MDFLEALAFSLLENHFKERANVKNLPLDIKAFLANYKEEPQNPSPVVQANIRRSRPCHECGKHRNNKTTVLSTAEQGLLLTMSSFCVQNTL